MEELVRFKGTQFEERVVETMLRLYHQGEFDSLRDMRAEPLPFVMPRAELEDVVTEPMNSSLN